MGADRGFSTASAISGPKLRRTSGRYLQQPWDCIDGIVRSLSRIFSASRSLAGSREIVFIMGYASLRTLQSRPRSLLHQIQSQFLAAFHVKD